MQKFSTKYSQIEPNRTLKGSHITIKQDLSLGCKDDSIYHINRMKEFT